MPLPDNNTPIFSECPMKETSDTIYYSKLYYKTPPCFEDWFESEQEAGNFLKFSLEDKIASSFRVPKSLFSLSGRNTNLEPNFWSRDMERGRKRNIEDPFERARVCGQRSAVAVEEDKKQSKEEIIMNVYEITLVDRRTNEITEKGKFVSTNEKLALLKAKLTDDEIEGVTTDKIWAITSLLGSYTPIPECPAK